MTLKANRGSISVLQSIPQQSYRDRELLSRPSGLQSLADFSRVVQTHEAFNIAGGVIGLQLLEHILHEDGGDDGEDRSDESTSSTLSVFGDSTAGIASL